VTGGVLALHTRPTPGAFNRVGVGVLPRAPAGLVTESRLQVAVWVGLGRPIPRQ
jgi:hypothetical protein